MNALFIISHSMLKQKQSHPTVLKHREILLQVVIFLIYVGETIDFGICRDTGIPG
jgi:hypothetical protein